MENNTSQLCGNLSKIESFEDYLISHGHLRGLESSHSKSTAMNA